jgi:hypothetical protein
MDSCKQLIFYSPTKFYVMSNTSKFPSLSSFKQIARQQVTLIVGGATPKLTRTYDSSGNGTYDYVGQDLVDFPDK